MRHAIFVTGPAGSGKSTFCSSMITHLQVSHRTAHLMNLDPAAERFEYEPSIDIKQLISLEDVMTELDYGPNGGLVYCFEYLLENLDWLDEELGEYESDYILIDCPGQIELYTHHPLLPSLVKHLDHLGFRTCAVYLVESQFIEDRYKFFSGVLSAMSAMVNLSIPWINILSKMDLVTGGGDPDDPNAARNGLRKKRDIARYLDPDPMILLGGNEVDNSNSRFHTLNKAIVQLIEDHPLVQFLPLDLTNTDSLENALSHIDHILQFGEDEEPKEPKDLDEGDFPEELFE